jgi:hypothetical protein
VKGIVELEDAVVSKLFWMCCMFMLCIYLRNALFFALLYNAILFSLLVIFSTNGKLFFCFCVHIIIIIIIIIMLNEMHSISQATESLQNN